jgi:hypothetical protein
LVELLVGCGIIAVLAVILTAGLNALVKKSYVPGDLNNFRQIAVAYAGYLAENNYRMPPVNMPNKYTQDFLAEQMDMPVNLHDPKVGRKQLAPWISPGDKRVPPYLSALRSYAVNYYSGEIVNLSSGLQAIKYSDISQPSKKLYFLPADGQHTDPNAQARFTHLMRPIVEGASGWMEIRFYEGNVTPALWMDGHASMVSKSFIQRNAEGLILPKVAPTEK